MISLSAPVFDLIGNTIIQELPDSDISTIRRRINRSPTLDGGVAVNDFGHAVGDRTFAVTWLPGSAAELESVQRLVRLYGRLVAVTPEGAFVVAPEDIVLSGTDGQATLTLLVIRYA